MKQQPQHKYFAMGAEESNSKKMTASIFPGGEK
jgi:hypothetical protein